MDYAGRRQTLRRRMEEREVELAAVPPGANMRYLLGYSPHPDERPCYLLLSGRSEAMLMPAINATQARERVDVRMDTYADEEGPDDALRRLLEELGCARARRVRVDETMRADFVLLLQAHLPGAELGVTTELLGPARMRKDTAELDALRRNAALADDAMRAAFSALQPGMTELAVAGVVRSAFMEAGAEPTFVVVCAGPNGAYPHHATGGRQLRAGEPVMLDVGATLDGYNSDLTRVAHLGEPSGEYRRVHAVVNRAVEAALAVIRPGVEARRVDAAARSPIADAGYAEYFPHRVGHGLGMTIHEPPYMTAANTLPLEEGMVFSVEPGVYLPGRFGIRLEEIVCVTRDGAEVLSGLPREIHVSAPG